MASQQKIQEYLQRHKIGALFEELMGKIVVDQPDDPIRHLIGILQSKTDRKSEKSMLSKSVTNTVPARMRSSSPERSKLAASFAGEKMLSEKDRQYNKPWLANTKPMKSKTDSTDLNKSVLKIGEKGSKMDLSNFEDIFEDLVPAKKSDVMIIANKVEEAKHPAFTRFQHSVNQVMIINRVQDELMRHQTEEELLSAEVPISIRMISEAICEELKNISSSLGVTASSEQPVSRYCKGPKANALSHKKKLEEIVLKEEQKKRKQQELSYDSGYEEHQVKDSAIELLEDVELLRMEGVTNPKASGYKIRTVPTVDVKVSICARCARFLDGDVFQTSPASPVRASSFGQLPSYAKGKESNSRPTSGRGAPSPVAVHGGRLSPTEGFLTPRRHETPSPGPFQSDDEEFESVSQVTGPRHPVWQEEEEEVMTPRKGTNMLSQSLMAIKPNRSSSHSEVAVGGKSQGKMTSSGALRSTGPITGTQKSGSAARRSSFQLSDIEAKKVSIKEVEKDENIVSSLVKSSNQWVVPDYDTDGSTVYVTGAGRSTTKNYKPRAY